MKIQEVQLYKQKYKANKVTFNSTKGAGKIVEGIATQIVQSEGLLILRDSQDFPHCVSILTLEQI
jgi:hypothetical protein